MTFPAQILTDAKHPKLNSYKQKQHKIPKQPCQKTTNICANETKAWFMVYDLAPRGRCLVVVWFMVIDFFAIWQSWPTPQLGWPAWKSVWPNITFYVSNSDVSLFHDVLLSPKFLSTVSGVRVASHNPLSCTEEQLLYLSVSHISELNDNSPADDSSPVYDDNSPVYDNSY